jgi:Trp operon repressor
MVNTQSGLCANHEMMYLFYFNEIYIRLKIIDYLNNNKSISYHNFFRLLKELDKKNNESKIFKSLVTKKHKPKLCFRLIICQIKIRLSL